MYPQKYPQKSKVLKQQLPNINKNHRKFAAFIRHLTESQRAMVAASLADMPSHRPKNKGANLHPSNVSAEKAGQILNVSERSVKTAKKVQQNATPELIEKVQKAAIAVDTLPLFEREAKKRQVEAGKDYGRGQEKKVVQKIEQPINKKMESRAIEQAAKQFGTNRQYVSDAKKIKEQNPTLIKELMNV